MNHNVKQTAQTDQLISRWSSASDAVNADAALCQIALTLGFTQQTASKLTELEHQGVMQWLQEHYPFAHMLAMSQRSLGHPAMVWGRRLNAKSRVGSTICRPA